MGGDQPHYESREKSLLRHNNFQSHFLPRILLRNKSSEKYGSSYISVFVDKHGRFCLSNTIFILFTTVAHKSLIQKVKK